jgi:PAS domain S-box-containing protein
MPRLADLLEAQIDSLLKQWIAGVRAWLAPDTVRAPELADHLPMFLRQVIATLREPEGAQVASGVGREHGAQRFRLGFELEAVVREYGLLLHLVLDVVEAEGTTVSIHEVRHLIDIVTAAVAEATSEYARRLTATEVTAEIAARRAAEATSAEFEAMFNSMTDGVYLGDATGVLRANGPGLELLGVQTIEELRLPRPTSRARLATRLASTGELLAADQSNFTRALAGETFTEDYLITHPIGHRELRIRSLATPVRVGGEIVKALIINTDVTEQHRALEVLRLSEETFRTLAEAIPQQVWTSTPDGALDFVNQRVLDYFQASKEKVLGDGWQAVIHPDDLPSSVARWTHSVTTGQEYDVEFRLRRGDQTYRWHLARALPVRGPGGEIVKWFGTNTDIDETKRVREELERRTTFEQHLLGIVSHDLRNPLGAILLGATGLLELGSADELVMKVAQRIHSSAERSVRMISDLLDFTQARLGGGIRIERRAADLGAVVGAAIDEVAPTFPERVVELATEGDTHGLWDADRIAQVVSNLVTNALKYSPSGTPVKVRASRHDDTVQLTIHNEGPPIPEERLGAIFEPLQRATAEIDLKTRSVGLGLYIVNAIVLAHGGTVAVDSTAEAGTTFTVRLPRGQR